MTVESNEIVITRTYDAPVAAVWEAWTDPAQTEQWWGPRGFTLTTHSKDLRPGGSWVYTMHGPDGVDYPNKTQYFEVVAREKLVYDHGANDERPPMFRVTVRFSESGGKTTMDMRMGFPTPEAAAQARAFIKQAGGDATWDRLAEYLAKKLMGKEIFVINRSFDAPIESIFAMWTAPEQLAQWLPPTAFQMQFKRADIRPGGHTLFSMSGCGIEFYARADYVAVEKPRQVVYTQQFCDKEGNVSRHPMAPTWPDTLLVRADLSGEGSERTRVTVSCEPHGDVTPEELDVFAQSKAGMTQGWTGSFDKLEAYLASR
ncbi:MAG: SRPBCC family protein [Telluria sp.]